MGAAASINVEHVPGLKELYEAKKAEGADDAAILEAINAHIASLAPAVEEAAAPAAEEAAAPAAEEAPAAEAPAAEEAAPAAEEAAPAAEGAAPAAE